MARKPADQSVSRDDIIKAAADVLREKGHDATTMKEIAARVNLTAASLYHHFRNKDFLLLAVLERGLAVTIGRLEPIVKSDKSACDKLSEMINSHIVSITNNPAVGAAMVFEIKSLMNADTAEGGNSDRDEFIQRRNEFFKQRDYFESLFRETVLEGIEQGEFRPVDAAIVAKAILGAHNWVGVWYKSSGRLTGSEIAAIMIDTFLTSLKVKN